MREIVFGSYHTASDGWTLTEYTLSPAQYVQRFVAVPGRPDGALDLSTALTGEPIYDSRTLSSALELSFGTRADRNGVIGTVLNLLDGYRMEIRLPDDANHYLVGRVHVESVYSNAAHAAIAVSAICDPWRYAAEETTVRLTASTQERTAHVGNSGRRTVVPVVTIAGGSVKLSFDGITWEKTDGTYQLPDLRVQTGGKDITYSGTGSATLTYREAIL